MEMFAELMQHPFSLTKTKTSVQVHADNNLNENPNDKLCVYAIVYYTMLCYAVLSYTMFVAAAEAPAATDRRKTSR